MSTEAIMGYSLMALFFGLLVFEVVCKIKGNDCPKKKERKPYYDLNDY